MKTHDHSTHADIIRDLRDLIHRQVEACGDRDVAQLEKVLENATGLLQLEWMVGTHDARVEWENNRPSKYSDYQES